MSIQDWHAADKIKQVVNVIKRAISGPPEDENDTKITWLKVHTARMTLSAIPAMAFFLEAFVHMT